MDWVLVWNRARESFKVLTRVADAMDVWWGRDEEQKNKKPSIHLNFGSFLVPSSNSDPLGTFDGGESWKYLQILLDFNSRSTQTKIPLLDFVWALNSVEVGDLEECHWLFRPNDSSFPLLTASKKKVSWNIMHKLYNDFLFLKY